MCDKDDGEEPWIIFAVPVHTSLMMRSMKNIIVTVRWTKMIFIGSAREVIKAAHTIGTEMSIGW